MESFQEFWPIATGTVVVPAMWRLKKWINKDWPILWAGVMLVMNALLAYGVNWYLGAGLTLPDLWPFITGGIVTSAVVHAGWKTKDKLNA